MMVSGSENTWVPPLTGWSRQRAVGDQSQSQLRFRSTLLALKRPGKVSEMTSVIWNGTYFVGDAVLAVGIGGGDDVEGYGVGG